MEKTGDTILLGGERGFLLVWAKVETDWTDDWGRDIRRSVYSKPKAFMSQNKEREHKEGFVKDMPTMAGVATCRAVLTEKSLFGRFVRTRVGCNDLFQEAGRGARSQQDCAYGKEPKAR